MRGTPEPSSAETAILSALQDGAPEAFRAVFDEYSDRLFRVAIGVLRDPAGAEDAVQETFIKLVNGIDQFEGRSRLGTWLYRVARNEALQQLRRPERRQGSRLTDLDSVTEQASADRLADPEAQLARSEALDTIDAALSNLPESLRAAFVLRDIESLSTAEAAEALEISESALKVRLHRARRAVRAAVAPEELPPTIMAAGLTCEAALSQLDDYLDDGLTAAQRQQLEEHVDQCEHCRIAVDSAHRTVELAGARRRWVIAAPRSSAMFDRLSSIFAGRRPTEPGSTS